MGFCAIKIVELSYTIENIEKGYLDLEQAE